MDVIRFALGFRFDPAECCDERAHAFTQLFSRIDPALFEGMHLYAGHQKIDENDDERIFTVITMGQGMKRTKALYNAVKADPYIMSLLADHRPIIQTNVIFHFEGFDYYGVFDAQGALSGGTADAKIERRPVSELQKAEYAGLSVAIAPDKYKGSLCQFEAADILKAACRKALPGARIICVPAADGGDGTMNVLCRALGGRKKKLTVTGPDWKSVDAEYCMIGNDTAVIEMASASGLALVRGPLEPMDATSFGTGELIRDALRSGAKKLLIAVGGSATNDAGIGAAVALGVKFTDDAGNEYEGCASNMEYVRNVDLSGAEPLLNGASITVLCDVTNPMTGENGATAVFGPQKGAAGETLRELERGMVNMQHRYDSVAGREVCSQPGAGAAGGMGAMLAALFNAGLVRGADTVLELMDFDKLIDGADIVVTGEGMFDDTSVLSGKAVGCVIAHALEKGALPVVIAGCLGKGWQNAASSVKGDICVYSTVTGPEGRLMETDAERLASAAERAFVALRAARKI